MITDPVHVDKISGQTTTGHEWDGIRELNTPLPRWWLWLFYLSHRLLGRLLDRLSVLAAGQQLPPRPVRNHQPHPGGGGRRGGPGGAHAAGGGSRKGEPPADRGRSETAGDRARSGQGGVRRQLRAVPRLGRPGPEGLSQPDGGPLAVGRNPRPDRRDDHARHPRRRPGHPHERHAGLRQGRDPEARADPAGRQLRSDPRAGSNPSRASTSPPARRSSPTIASRATARTARATPTWARPT